VASQTSVDMGEDVEAPADEPRAASLFRRVNEGIGRVEVGALMLLVATLIGSAVYDLLDPRATWSDELTRYGVFFIAMIGMALAAQRQGMFHMDLVTRLFPARLRCALRIGTALLIAATCAVVIRFGIAGRAHSFDRIQDYDIVSEATGYLALIAGFALVAIHFLLHAAIELAYLAAGKVPPDPPHGGH
jgi:TRAP-type C4-dicarboxylate transport system permease small subunit